MRLRSLTLCAGLATSLTCAAEPEFLWAVNEPHDWLVSVRVGADWANTGDSERVSVVEGFLEDKYTPSDTPFQVGYGIFGGGLWEANEWMIQFGLSYDYLPPFTDEGDILEFGDPALNDLSYEYRISHQRLGLELKTLYEMENNWYPFVRLGLGIAWNKAYRYREESSSPTEIARHPFKDTDNVALTWSVGAGVEREIYEDVRLGLSYLYTDAGRSKLDSRKSDESLTIDHLSLNQIILEASYIF
jgi:opacity protein-like surface antigen